MNEDWGWEMPDPEPETYAPPPAKAPAARKPQNNQKIEGQLAHCPECGDRLPKGEEWRDLCNDCFFIWANDNGETCILCGTNTWNNEAAKGYPICRRCKQKRKKAVNAHILANEPMLSSPPVDQTGNVRPHSTTCPHCGGILDLKIAKRIGDAR